MESFDRHTDYGQESLKGVEFPSEPMPFMRSWLVDAEEAQIYEPNAFVLGTIDANGVPNARNLLLKGIVGDEFFFATNYRSRKGSEIETNPGVSMVFSWYAMHRQVIVQGTVGKASREDSEGYFLSRPHDSQVASWLSKQSEPIESFAKLDSSFTQALERFEGKEVPTPEHWGGYLIQPLRIEFWQGRTSRMHHRLEFTRSQPEQAWTSRLLQP